jgi:hypothetical protein
MRLQPRQRLFIRCSFSAAKVTALAKLTGRDVTVVKGAGHMMPKDYVGAVLKGWLGDCVGRR